MPRKKNIVTTIHKRFKKSPSFKLIKKKRTAWKKALKKSLITFHKRSKAHKKDMHKKLAMVGGAVFLMFVMAYSTGAAMRSSANLIAINGLEVSGEEVQLALGGQQYEEIRAMLNEELNAFLEEEFTFHYQNTDLPYDTRLHPVTTSYKFLGATVDIDEAMELIRDDSEGSGNLEHFSNRLAAIGGSNVEVPFHINPLRFRVAMEHLLNLKKAQSASVMINEDRQLSIQTEITGRGIDQEAVTKTLYSYLQDLAWPSDMTIEISTVTPPYNARMAMGDMKAWEDYLQKEVNLSYGDFNQTLPAPPNWIMVQNGEITYNASSIQSYLSNMIAPEVNQAKQDAYLRSFPTEGEGYVDIEGVPIDGRELDVYTTASHIISSLETDLKEGNANSYVNLTVKEIPGRMVNETGEDLGPLAFIGGGEADFSQSSDARGHNVEKAVNERLGNYLIPPGEILSYNERLSFHSTSGWVVGYGIFGGEAKPVRGGGVCHGSTVLGRAAFNIEANVEFLEHHNHSWYLASYYGDQPGLDFTIYPGGKDFTLRNNTGNYMLMQAYTRVIDGRQMAYVNFYGQGDGRTVTMEGPYFSNNDVPEEYKEYFNIGRRTIGWMRKTVYEDGTIDLQPHVPRYNSWYN